MIKMFSRINWFCDVAEQLKARAIIQDYRIAVKVNNNINIYLLIPQNNVSDLNDYFELAHSDEKVKLEKITNEDCKSDSFYEDLFRSPDKVNFDSRRRFSNILDLSDDNYKAPCPVITFYSYKGGMGRSTTIASCASYITMHYGKKIVIIDCDLEAPGFTNYYLEEPDVLNHKNGLVEYLIDKDFLAGKVDVNKYMWEVSKEFTGEGEIHIMPAGNLSDEIIKDDLILENHRTHYLEGLSRIDISSDVNIINQFRELIKDIYDAENPDYILIDSRTGFNDILGITAFNLSDMVIGFFGINAQNIPGLHFFLDSIKNTKKKLQTILVNSIITSHKYFPFFEEQVDRYLSLITRGEEEPISINKYAISRQPVLENLGTKDEYKPDFINLIKNKQFSDFNKLFEKIVEMISFSDSTNYGEVKIEIPKSIPRLDYNAIDLTKITTEDKIAYEKDLKSLILTKLHQNWPDLYAKNIDYEKESREKRYFFRGCMEDVFNSSKFLIIGNKGTGKTYLYQSLRNPEIVQQLQKRANKIQYHYEFFHLIDNKDGKYLDTLKFDDVSDAKNELFFEKFWLVYIWNAIMLESESRLGFKSELSVFPIKDDTTTKTRFLEWIRNDQILIKIENDLQKLDSYLSKNNKKQLIVIFDELDQIVKPLKWSERIAPLINYWRKTSFSKISPKLFIRSDLFNKLSNITNVKELKNQSISIEWTQEELYAFFFKLVFSKSKDEFFGLMKLYGDYDSNTISAIKRKAGQDNQLPLDISLLRPLVETFFGKYAGINNDPRFGESYNWFFKNLKNADNTISLRPFIDLLAESIKFSITDDKRIKPILPQFYYVHSEARKNAVQRHFEDLAAEKGNTDLKLVFEYIRTKANEKYKFIFLDQKTFEELLTLIIDSFKHTLENKSVDSLKALLIVNGIISERFYSGRVEYIFALLYKYYLGLKNKPKRMFYKTLESE